MNHRSLHLRICAVLFVTLFSSIALAQVNSVPDRATLAGTDFIDWQSVDDGVGDFTWLSVPDVTSGNGEALVVTQQESPNSLIINESSPWPWFRDTNMPDGSYLFDTHINNNNLNPVSFSYADGRGFCGLGTQVAPFETGTFIARIEAFDVDDASIGSFDVSGSSADPEAAFAGISSTDPMHRVEVSVVDTEGGLYAAIYAINRVDLKACPDVPPPVPAMSCDGFAAPMADYPVTTKGNRVFPLKMELFDEYGFEQTDVELVAAPIVTVLFTTPGELQALDVTSQLLGAGHGSEGNQFVFTENDAWEFNLKSKNYSAPGTYVVTAVSGDESAYVIDPLCVTSFIKY